MHTSLRKYLVALAVMAAPLAYAGDHPNQTLEERSTTPSSGQSAVDTGLKGSTGSTGEMGASGKGKSRDAAVRKAAEQGPDALRRYIERTRAIYNYNYSDYAKDN